MEREFVVEGLGPRGEWAQAGRLVLPAGRPPRALIVAVPGGTSTGAYFRRPAEESLAEFAAARGYAVLSLDTLGTGASSRPVDGDELTIAAAAAAIARAAADAAEQLDVRLVFGCGHSLGAGLVARAQADHGSFAGVALLGYSPRWRSLPAAEMVGVAAKNLWPWALTRLQAADPGLWSGSYIAFAPATTGGEHEPVPRGLAVEFGLPALAGPTAAQVDVPVFLGFGELEPFRADEEVDAYPKAPSVASFVLAGAGHCHYEAENRLELHGALLSWIENVEADTTVNRGHRE